MQKKISTALISVFNKKGILPVANSLQKAGAKIYSTGGTQQHLEAAGIKCTGVEEITGYPSILGGRVKTLHPSVFGGILARRAEAQDMIELKEHRIPELDLVIVDLYPFEETLRTTDEEKLIVEKIDIGGPSMIRAAAKNFSDLLVVASADDYHELIDIMTRQRGETSVGQRKAFAAKAFKIVMDYDIAISNYFNTVKKTLRYGENPHQAAFFTGKPEELFEQLHGKELSYNNLVDTDAALQLMDDLNETAKAGEALFAIIKHTNVCGAARRFTVKESWEAALGGDPESAFGGVLVCNKPMDIASAQLISEVFFEVLIAPAFETEALTLLSTKKNRILLQSKSGVQERTPLQVKSVLNGLLTQETDRGNYSEWKEAGGRETTAGEKEDLVFANIICKHLKSNAIALVKNAQLIGKGCGQTSRIDALRQALEKAKQFHFSLQGAVLASDAFFPFSDCVELAAEAGIVAFIQPGGSVRDKDSTDYCVTHGLAMVMTGRRHFRH